MFSTTTLWLALGFTGQAMFSARFLVQWFVSERAGRSIVPEVFWYLSIFGGVTLLSYAVWRQDPVIILGQATGLIVYVRNLVLLKRSRKSDLALQETGATPAP
jgi:lipid-A-disaccharide synthase-like uncharacterized protein